MKLSANAMIAILAVVVGLFWSMPALRALTVGSSTQLEVWLSVLIRILIVFGVVKAIVAIAKKVK